MAAGADVAAGAAAPGPAAPFVKLPSIKKNKIKIKYHFHIKLLATVSLLPGKVSQEDDKYLHLDFLQC